MSKRNLMELASEGIEVLVDSSLDNGIIKDIPFVGWVAKTYDAASGIRDKLFALKILKFVESIEEIKEEDKQKIREKMSQSPEEAAKIGEAVTLTIEKINDADKSDIIANLFIAYTQNVLESSELRRLTDIIDRVFIDDLLELVTTHNIGKSVNHSCFGRLRNTDLIDIQSGEKIDDIGKQFYHLSKLGKKYINAYHHGMKLRKS